MNEFLHFNINDSFVRFGMDVLLVFTAILSFRGRNNSKLLAIGALFLIISLLSLLVNIKSLDITSFMNGMRDFIPYFFFPVLYINLFRLAQVESLIKKFDKFLYIFLASQIPVTLMQFMKYGAGDSVGGTLGVGSSGNLTILVYSCTYFLMIKDFDQKRYFRSFMKKSYLLIFWIPSFLNETKISFLMMILFFLFLAPVKANAIFKYVMIMFLIIPVTYLFDHFYAQTTGHSFFDEILTEDYVDRYLVGDRDTNEDFDIPRLAKINMAFQIQKDSQFWFGNGPGQFKGGTTLSLTPFALRYQWLLKGSIPMLFLIFVQVGMFGLIIFIIFWLTLLRISWKNRLVENSKNIGLFLSAVFILIMFYNQSLRNLFVCGILMYFMIFAGYWNGRVADADR